MTRAATSSTRKPVPLNRHVSTRMKGNKAIGTQPELRFRALLSAAGIRGYRLNDARLPGRPDVVFTRKRLAVFVHGCFWHLCPYCQPPIPKHNTPFWRTKLLGNRARDKAHTRQLRHLGWRVLVIRECQLLKHPAGQLERLKRYL